MAILCTGQTGQLHSGHLSHSKSCVALAALFGLLWEAAEAARANGSFPPKCDISVVPVFDRFLPLMPRLDAFIDLINSDHAVPMLEVPTAVDELRLLRLVSPLTGGRRKER
jgi:hypothetical protein